MRSTHDCSRWTGLVGLFCRVFLMHSKAVIAHAVAGAFLSGALDVDEMVKRGGRVLGKRWRWLRPLARRVREVFGGRPRPRRRAVMELILRDPPFAQAYGKEDLRLANLVSPPRMTPSLAFTTWNRPPISSMGALAEWLDVSVGELEWFADLRNLEFKCNQGRLRHYNYRVLAKRFGQIRLVEAPKPRLKAIQRRILSGILDNIPPHDAVHGFRRSHSTKTFVSPHIGQRVVLRIDLQDFFPSIPAARIQALFRTIGYPESVSDLLTGLCTNATPLDVWEGDTFRGLGDQTRIARGLYSRTHLPQGAPTSPALANLCAYRTDCRLTGLAASAGAVYTRYADDLAFSGGVDFERVVKRFSLHVCATLLEEGFTPHYRKTRIMRRGVRQHLAGIVVNKRLNVVRADYDRLKATLTNCVRLGPDSQNRLGVASFRDHLNGRITYVEMLNPVRGQRLRELFLNIKW
jgi:RNA-directed DNA polymerase